MKGKTLKQFVTEMIALIKNIPAHSYADILEQKAQECDSVYCTSYDRTIKGGEIKEELEIDFKDLSHISIIKACGRYTLEIIPSALQGCGIEYRLITINKQV